jgi:hypothetical protein
MVHLRLTRIVVAIALGVSALAGAGCAGKEEAGGDVPASASLAPRDALGFVTLVTDEGSEQWKNADDLLQLFPEARETLLAELESELSSEGLSWKDDVGPALGPEVVVVVTKDTKIVVLVQPDDQDALDALLRRPDSPLVKQEVSGWTALAQDASDISAYRVSLAQGSLDDVELFRESISALPSDAIARGWVDLRSLAEDITEAVGETAPVNDIGVEDLAAAVSAEQDGLLVSLSVRTPDGIGTTTYEPALFDRVPADAVAALSFGGTQGVLDRVERSIDLDEISGAIDDAIGISFDNVFEALSGEGVLYLRDSGGDIPEVTLVLDPPNADKTWSSIEDVARKLADDAGGRIETGTESGRPVNRLVLEGVTVVYARVDSETLFVTTGQGAIAEFLSDGSKLVDDEAFRSAAERVDLGERTTGFAYVDLDGLIPFIESVAGPETVPDEARDVLTELDSFILQSDADGDLTRVSGFLHIPG